MFWFILRSRFLFFFFFFFQAEDGIRDYKVTGVQTCALPILWHSEQRREPVPFDVRNAIVPRQALIDEGVVRGQQIHRFAVLPHDAIEEWTFGISCDSCQNSRPLSGSSFTFRSSTTSPTAASSDCTGEISPWTITVSETVPGDRTMSTRLF